MQLVTERQDLRIDIDGVDGLKAVAQSGLDVVAGPGADDDGQPAALGQGERQVVDLAIVFPLSALELGRGRVLQRLVGEVVHELVEVAVHRKLDAGGVASIEVDPVIRREDGAPLGVGRQDADQRGADRSQRRPQQDDEREDGERQPEQRPGVRQRARGEHEYARQRTGEIGRIRPQRREAVKERAEGGARRGKNADDERDEPEEDRHRAQVLQEAAVELVAAPERDALVRKAQVHQREFLRQGERDGERQDQRQGEVGQPGAALPERHAATHAEKGADQHDVVEVGEDADLAGGPADQRQLERQDPERGDRDGERGGRETVGPGCPSEKIHRCARRAGSSRLNP